jgi:hypothetical protein
MERWFWFIFRIEVEMGLDNAVVDSEGSKRLGLKMTGTHYAVNRARN